MLTFFTLGKVEANFTLFSLNQKVRTISEPSSNHLRVYNLYYCYLYNLHNRIEWNINFPVAVFSSANTTEIIQLFEFGYISFNCSLINGIYTRERKDLDVVVCRRGICRARKKSVPDFILVSLSERKRELSETAYTSCSLA